MFKYTKAIYTKTKRELETALRIFQLGTQVLYIAYLICALLARNSIWYLHLTLLIISLAFLAFDVVTHNNLSSVKKEKVSFFKRKTQNNKLKKIRKLRRNIKKWKFYISHLLKAFVLATAFYPIIVSPYSVHPLSVICTTVMAFTWIMQIVFEVLRLILEDRGEMFIEAIRADVEFITKPVNTVKNTINKFFGKEVNEDEEPTDERVYLDNLVEKEEAQASDKGEKISEWLNSRISKFMKRSDSTTDAKEYIVISSDNDDDI